MDIKKNLEKKAKKNFQKFKNQKEKLTIGAKLLQNKDRERKPNRLMDQEKNTLRDKKYDIQTII